MTTATLLSDLLTTYATIGGAALLLTAVITLFAARF